MTELWLLRHGQTDWNLTGRWQGQASNAPGLNETGFSQASSACEKLKDIKIAAIYSSDLLRARQTAEVVAARYGLPVHLEPRLREIDLGLWEGMLAEDIKEQYHQELAEREKDPFHASAPQGESPKIVSERVLAAVNEIVERHRGEPVLIVGHGVSLSVILCRSEGFPMEEIYQHIPENGNPYLVIWS